MLRNQFLRLIILCFFWVLWHAQVSSASFEKDPIKDTQSKVVPVTQELLTREGEPGPASPSFKMSDTSGFLVKKDYEEADIHQADQWLEESQFSDADEWFSWEEEDESGFASEPIAEK